MHSNLPRISKGTNYFTWSIMPSSFLPLFYYKKSQKYRKLYNRAITSQIPTTQTQIIVILLSHLQVSCRYHDILLLCTEACTLNSNFKNQTSIFYIFPPLLKCYYQWSYDLIDMNMSINELKVGPNEPVMMIAWPWMMYKRVCTLKSNETHTLFLYFFLCTGVKNVQSSSS